MWIYGFVCRCEVVDAFGDCNWLEINFRKVNFAHVLASNSQISLQLSIEQNTEQAISTQRLSFYSQARNSYMAVVNACWTRIWCAHSMLCTLQFIQICVWSVASSSEETPPDRSLPIVQTISIFRIPERKTARCSSLEEEFSFIFHLNVHRRSKYALLLFFIDSFWGVLHQSTASLSISGRC